MSIRVVKYGLLVPLVVLAGACDRAELSIAAPAPLSAPTDFGSSFGIEPEAVHPEFLPGPSCTGSPAFGARLSIVIGGRHGIIVRRVRFAFTDRFGAAALPQVLPVPSLTTPGFPATGLPSSSPITLPGIGSLPGASPISIPGSPPVHGLLIPAGSTRAFPFFLQFGCGIAGNGILIVVVETADDTGRLGSSELRVRIGTSG